MLIRDGEREHDDEDGGRRKEIVLCISNIFILHTYVDAPKMHQFTIQHKAKSGQMGLKQTRANGEDD
ncbi:hypothetical protein L249_6199 [Ophiocordyceps polyrhachis-furcata BCC 54312]|uniref:Uncharacterized protein n=1 Tax=Ophiocordyceps polyrhachis-furcata BCC 54312 TaxID=1330021 RepID=A0A367LIH2_9HYPO|nr:hypothetical protein L249_6199 [Ophiocordyceps polyrhachis-furcata BCC 54312]